MPTSKKIVTQKALRDAAADLRAFRHDVAQLKKKGLLDKTLYDARKVTPSKYLKSQIKKFADVLKGESAATKVSRKKAQYYKMRGYTVKNNHVIVPVTKNEKVYSRGGDFHVKIIGSNGSITKIDLGLSRENVSQWMDDLQNNRFKLKKDEVLSFQMYGHNSLRSGFSNYDPIGKDKHGNPIYKKGHDTAQEQLARYLSNYPAYQKADLTDNPEDNDNWIDGIVILKIKRNKNGSIPPAPEYIDKTISLEKIKTRRERRALSRVRKLAIMTDAEYDAAMDNHAETERVRRANMTPAQKQQYKFNARLRAAKHYAKKNVK